MLKFLCYGFLVVCITLLYSNGGASGGLIELRGPSCGTLVCKADEYCNQYSHGCESCTQICESSHHNFDPLKCREQCEVYIYDQRYFKRTADGAEEENLRIAVQKLELKSTVSISLAVIAFLLLLIVITFLVWQWKTNNNVTWATIHHKISRKKSDNNTNGVSTNKISTGDQTGRKPELRLDISANSVQSEPTPVTTTTGITSRIPAEDSIDYAYDNPAMSNSPKNPGSTTS